MWRSPSAADHRSMQEHCVVFSLLPGRGESARDFMRQLADGRRAEQERSERRIGIGGARWFLGQVAAGELLIGMIDSRDLARALGLLSVSMDPHDLWFKRRFADATGVDFNDTQAIVEAALVVSTATPPSSASVAAAPPPMAAALAGFVTPTG
jgi:hypothetical protein